MSIRCFFLEPAGLEDTELFRRTDTGELMRLGNAPVGAMWYADWMIGRVKDDPGWRWWRGPDGRCLVVRLPGGHDWLVDGRCSNCTLPEDNVHKCWVRHGVPPNVTVD